MIIQQKSRIQLHTVSLTSSVMTVPNSEDFTSGTWSTTDLYNSEIGVNRMSEKAYLRIDNNIKEFAFVGVTSSAYNFEQTLSVNNNSGTYSIQLGSASTLEYNTGLSNSTAGIAVCDAGTGEVVVTTSAIKTNSLVFLTAQNESPSGLNGSFKIKSRNDGVNFTIMALTTGDTSDVGWMIVNTY